MATDCNLIEKLAILEPNQVLNTSSRPISGDNVDSSSRTLERLALFGALAIAFEGMHGFCDTWLQRPQDAARKGLHGSELAYPSDGALVDQAGHRLTETPRTLSAIGRKAAIRHVCDYELGQLATAVVVTHSLGYRPRWTALAAGAVINGLTHAIIDRRKPLRRLAHHLRCKDNYIDQATVVRKTDSVPDSCGPGTALYELDQSLHRAIGVFAAAVTTWLATRH